MSILHFKIFFVASIVSVFIAIGCNKNEQSNPIQVEPLDQTDEVFQTIDSRSIPNMISQADEEMSSTLLQCSCTEYIDGEPTPIQAGTTYNYDPIPLLFSCGSIPKIWGTIKYDAKQVQNRFRVVSSTGVTVLISGWVSGIGSLSFCATTTETYSLYVSAKSSVNAIDRWNVTKLCGTSCP